MTSFGHIVSFICAKEMLELMRPLVTALQGRLVEVYLGFQKIKEVISSYTEIREVIDSWFKRVYVKAVTLAQLVGSTEGRPHVCSNRENQPAESDTQYWKRTLAIPFSRRHLLRAQKSLQQRKEGTLRALRSNSSGHRF